LEFLRHARKTVRRRIDLLFVVKVKSTAIIFCRVDI
jgi:hypothetical protein